MESNDDHDRAHGPGPAGAEEDFGSPNAAQVAGRAKASISFQAASGVISQIIRFGAGIVLARLLEPEEFGILAMAEIVKGFARSFANVGLVPSIIQKETVSRQFLSTAFWFNLLVAALFCFGLMLISPLAGSFFRNPEVGPVLRISSLNLFVMASFTVWNALLMRSLRFPIVSSHRVLEATLSGVFCIILALLGYGVYAIAYGVLASSIVSLLIIFPFAQRQIHFRPTWTFSWRDMRNLVGFGALVRLKDSINYLAMNVDYFLIGRFLGAGLLGHYRRAYSIMFLPVEVVAHRIIGPVLFPAMSRIQHDTRRMVSWYEKAIVSCGLLVLPGLVGMIAVAPEFIQFVYGPKWHPAIAPLQILCLAGTITVISTFSGAILTARRLVARELIHQLIYFFILASGIYLVTRNGGEETLVNVGFVVLGARLFVYIANQQYVNKMFKQTWLRIAIILWPICVSLVVEYGVAELVRSFLLEKMKLDTFPTLMLTSAAGGGAYLMAIWIVRSNVSKDIIDRGVLKARRTISDWRMRKPIGAGNNE